MESENAIDVLHALAHGGRLSVLRLLIQAGRDGMPAGEVARALKTPPNSMSAQLAILTRAGLIRARRESRSIIYSAAYERMGDLLEFLLADCCAGSKEVCRPLADVVARLNGCATNDRSPQPEATR